MGGKKGSIYQLKDGPIKWALCSISMSLIKIWCLATQKGLFFYEDERFQQATCTPKPHKRGTLYSTPKGVFIQSEEPQSLGEIPDVEWSKSDQGWHPIALEELGKTLHQIVREHGL